MNTADALKLVACLTTEATIPTPSGAPAWPEKLFIRTVTHYHVGRVVSMDDRWIVLDSASWVADTGRFSVALATGKLGEVELFAGPVWVAVGSIVDMTAWPYTLPTVSK
jgi:hypothetical protein